MTKDEVQKILKWLNGRYRYRRDGKIDSWRIMPLEGEMLVGDCDDYVTTLMFLLSGESNTRLMWDILRAKYVPWFCKMPDGQYHVVLWVKGHGWIDNGQRIFTEEAPNYQYYVPIPFFATYIKMFLGKYFR